MDELQISGRRFISARRIAKENGYTSDYIGQLIRGGKIVGQKVGRAWYVDALSFDRYLGSEATATEVPVVAISEEPAEEAPRAETVKVVEESPAPAPVVPPPTSTEEASIKIETNEPEAEVVLTKEVTQDLKEEEATPASEVVVKNAIVHEVAPAPAAHTVALRIEKAEKKEEKTTSSAGLRYYADDAPLLPQLETEEETPLFRSVNEHSTQDALARPVSGSRGRLYITSLAVAGTAAFMLAAFLSTAVALNISITENAAAASYSLGW